MAATEAVRVKQLGELLKEQQEPFILETYLSEKRNRVTNSGSSKHQKKPRNGNLLPKLFRVVYNKLFRATNSDEPAKIISSTCVNENSFSLHGQEKTETDERMSSSASTTNSTTVSNSSSDIDTEQDDDQREKEVDGAAGSTCRWRIIMEETKEQSPVSVLQNIASRGVSKLNNVLLKPAEPTKRIITEDSILSASLWNILLQYSETRVHGSVNSSSSQSLMTKQVLEHNGQLLFDFVRELPEGKQKTTNCRLLLGSEEIGKLICKKINAWGTQAEDRTHADFDLRLDFCRGIEEQKSEIGLVIGDAILEKVTDEIVLDMVINLTNM